MRISTRSWHGRVYRWWCNSKHTAYRWRFDAPGRRRDNLCHYVRVVILYAPMLWVGTKRVSRGPAWLRVGHLVGLAVALLAVVVGLVLAPTETLDLLVTFGVAVGSIVLFLTIMYWLFVIHEWFEDRAKPDRGPGFAKVALELIKAKKRRVCPFIEVVDDAQ